MLFDKKGTLWSRIPIIVTLFSCIRICPQKIKYLKQLFLLTHSFLPLSFSLSLFPAQIYQRERLRSLKTRVHSLLFQSSSVCLYYFILGCVGFKYCRKGSKRGFFFDEFWGSSRYYRLQQ